MKLSRRSFFIILTIVLTIAVDQISKIIVRTYVVPSERSNIIGTYFTLHNVENVGAFLGMGSDLSPLLKLIFLLILPIVVLSFVTYHIFKDQSLDKVSVFAFASIIGGGIANVFDRVVYGSVTDFFHIDLGGVFRTGIFNMADLSVTTGMILLLLVSFKKKKEVPNQG
ncbi:signal peptidase II [Gaetbulibacter aquiaggeris]|uniref:Lipoprotein signal peptidase n=1 Tax=Gaetbulibacter aquiaggeris TaxID=1735373 RepID=A0ABW7MU14_9FLAO